MPKLTAESLPRIRAAPLKVGESNHDLEILFRAADLRDECDGTDVRMENGLA
jgi:hypothetical protein